MLCGLGIGVVWKVVNVEEGFIIVIFGFGVVGFVVLFFFLILVLNFFFINEIKIILIIKLLFFFNITFQ